MSYPYVLKQNHFRRLALQDIMLVEGGDLYATIVTPKENFLTRYTLSALEPLLGVEHFCRVHQEYIVSLAHILYFDKDVICVGCREVPLGRAFRQVFYSRIILLK